MLLSGREEGFAIAALRAIQAIFLTRQSEVTLSRNLWNDLKGLATDGGFRKMLTASEIDAMCERLSEGGRLCPYCLTPMTFVDYSKNEHSDNDHTAQWVCPNRACWAAVDEVRYPPNPYRYKAQREVLFHRGSTNLRLSAFDITECYILAQYDEVASCQIDVEHFDGPAQMWEAFYARVGEALFDGYEITHITDNC